MQLVKETITLPSSYSITGDQETVRNEIALRARAVKTVTSPETQELARASAVEIRRHLKDVEGARVILTKPLLDGQRLLKSLTDDYCTPLKQELDRLERLASDFQAAEQRRVAEAERVRQMELQRLDRERIAAEEAAAKAAQKINTNNQLANAIAKEETALEAANRVQEVLRAPKPEVIKAKGQTVKQMLRWQVTDIRALAVARPDLVRMEPNAAGIQATCIPEMPNLPPGLKLWYEDKVTFSSR